MNKEKYYKFIRPSSSNGSEYSILDELMSYITVQTRWDLYPFRMNKELDETDERKELIKQERRSVLGRFLKLLIAIGAIFAMSVGNIKGYEGLLLIPLVVSLLYGAYQILFIPLALVAPRVVVAFKEGEYPYLWISTWLNIIGSLIATFAFIYLIIMLLLALYHLLTFSSGKMVIDIFTGFFGFSVSLFAGITLTYFARFLYDEDSDRKYVYIQQPNGIIATRRRD